MTSAHLKADHLVATEIYGIPTGVTHPDQELFETQPKKKLGKSKTMKNAHLLKHSPENIRHTVILLHSNANGLTILVAPAGLK